MNGFCLLIPLLIIRFGWLSILNKQAVQRAGYFAPVQAGEVLPFYIYQVSNVVLFLYFLGTSLLTQSGILFVILLCFQISAHWIILSEELWCIEKFGDSYKEYMAKVPRYL